MIRAVAYLQVGVLEEHRKKHQFDKVTVIRALSLLAKQNV